MHDPMTVAHEIRRPWRDKSGWRPPLVTIWHVDPEKRGDDDSCDWFGRRRPLNKREGALLDAWDELSHVLGNRPFYPDPRLYGRYHPDDEDDHSVMKEMDRAMYAWRRHGFRWHPRWHVHHWSIQVHVVQKFKRWAFSRCAGCGKPFAWGYAPVRGGWYGTGPRWFRGEANVRHLECQGHEKEETFDYVAAGFENDAYEKWIKGDRV